MPRPRATGHQLGLFVRQAEHSAGRTEAEPAALRADGPVAQDASANSLWLCIAFPGLIPGSLGLLPGSTAIVISSADSRAVVVAATPAATAAGICHGMTLNAALALVPGLEVRQRDLAAESGMLHSLARWALRFSPVVSVDPDGAILLEARGSLRLFGGLASLRQRMQRELAQRGCTALIATAPVPRAALWMVRAGVQADYCDPRRLAGLLARLPLESLHWPADIRRKLGQMGVSTVGDCLRLPRDGFARRIGVAYLQELDRGLGRAPELLSHHVAPQSFSARIDLGGETLLAGEIDAAVRELLAGLADFLRVRQAGAQQLRFGFEHCRRPSSQIEISLREPSRQIRHMHELLRLRLERQTLTAPVTGIRLHVTDIHTVHDANRQLFGAEQGATAAQLFTLLERLRARLGHDRVYGLSQVADYRPERAWRAGELPAREDSAVPGEMLSRARPLWLLARPRSLEVRDNRPVYQGSLHFLNDAERIETGWWDGNDICRDYYTVAGAQGNRWWIFSDCRNAGWYLHGVFA